MGTNSLGALTWDSYNIVGIPNIHIGIQSEAIYGNPMTSQVPKRRRKEKKTTRRRQKTRYPFQVEMMRYSDRDKS